MGDWFVRPEIVRVPLSDDQWIAVKRRLTHGEQVAAYRRMYIPGLDGTLKPNPLTLDQVMVCAYLVDWSLTRDGVPVVITGQPVDVLDAILDALDPDRFTEIKAAVSGHEKAEAERRADEKKTPSGDLTSQPISASHADATGDMNGYETSIPTSIKF